VKATESKDKMSDGDDVGGDAVPRPKGAVEMDGVVVMKNWGSNCKSVRCERKAKYLDSLVFR
jgi:hypothetical protein